MRPSPFRPPFRPFSPKNRTFLLCSGTAGNESGKSGILGAKLEDSVWLLTAPSSRFRSAIGYRSQPKDITVWEDAPESLRAFVLDTEVEMGYRPHPLRDAICSVLHTRPSPGNWSEYPNVWGEV